MINIQNMPIVLQNFFDLKDNVDINNLKILNDMFEKIDCYEIKSTNILMDDLIIDGLIMKPSSKKKENYFKKNELESILALASEKLKKTANNIEEAYFYNTFIKLVNKFEFTTLEEQVILNFLFEEITEENKSLQEVSKDEKKYVIK